MQLVFISDLHLSPDTIENNRVFYKLLSTWQDDANIDALYILGDFFDYWLGDDDSNIFIDSMKFKLAKFTKNKPIYFITGNHDFALGKKFAKETGVIFIKDCSVINCADNQILLSHGDVFCTLDVAYQRMKKVLQNPILLTLLKLLPLSLRRKIKDMLEHKSSGVSNTKPKTTYHVVDESVRDIANKKLANIVIHGHTHNPGKYWIDNKIDNRIDGNVNNPNNPKDILRVEIPDWSDHKAGGYVLVRDNEVIVHNVN